MLVSLVMRDGRERVGTWDWKVLEDWQDKQ